MKALSILLLLVGISAAMAVTTSLSFGSPMDAQGGVCGGQVGDYIYDLLPLSQATGGQDVTCVAQDGNTFFYRPCQVLQQQQCQTVTDSTPAACFKDTRKIPQFHDCGSTSQIQWSPRPQGADTGFFIQFDGGESDRRLNVEFICDYQAGTGTLEAANPSEMPLFFYHLKWRSVYACPSNSPPPPPTPTYQCCVYFSIRQHNARVRPIKSTCDLLPHLCPFTLGYYRFAGNTTVSSCGECAMPKRQCCIYADIDNLDDTQTACTTDSCLPSFNTNYTLVGNTFVENCEDCFFA